MVLIVIDTSHYGTRAVFFGFVFCLAIAYATLRHFPPAPAAHLRAPPLRLAPTDESGVAGSYGAVASELYVDESVIGAALPLPPGGALPPRRHALPLPARLSDFSSFSCSAGSQRLDASLALPLEQLQTGEAFTAPRHRMCVLWDVCMVGGEITYYADEVLAAAAPPSSGASPIDVDVFLSAYYFSTQQGLWKPRVVASARPPELPFAPDDRVYFYDELSYAENYGHLLIDNILAAYAAAEVLDVDAGDIQLVGALSCANMHDKGLVIAKMRAEDRCALNLAAWSEALLTYRYLEPPYATDFCFRQLVVGYAPSFALSSAYAHRAATARAARLQAHARLGVPSSVPIEAHRVLVLLKRPEHAAALIPGLCELVQAWALGVAPVPRVDCIVPAELSIAEQLALQADVTVYVAEAGSTGYGAALFARPGASLICVVPFIPRYPSKAKEAQVFLFTSDVQVWYYTAASLDDDGGGPGALLLALDRAGVRLNLPPVALG